MQRSLYRWTLLFSLMFSSPQIFAQKPTTQRILVTGFYDWRDLGSPPQTARCRDNPSCRLLAGEGVGPRGFRGPLALSLQEWSLAQPSRPHLDFALLPVTWSALGTLPRERYHVIIHLGLGVYDSYHRILIEDGAYNKRKGVDATAVSRDEVIDSKAPPVLSAPSHVSERIHRAINARLPAPFHLVRAEARPDNVYLCNATHYEAIQEITQDPTQTERAAYFIHLPHREGQSDNALASATLEVIKSLLISP